MTRRLTWSACLWIGLGLLPGGAVFAQPAAGSPPTAQALCLSNLRLRESPARTASQVGSMYRGQIVCVLPETAPGESRPGEPQQWKRVRIPGGPTGWASAEYLSMGQPSPAAAPAKAWPTLVTVSQAAFSSLSDPTTAGLGGHNKPNGIQYRLRSHRLPGGQGWLGPVVPAWLPRRIEPDFELQILDPVAEGYFAFYRSGAAYGGNDHYLARLYAGEGRLLWETSLDAFLPVGQEREIQDIRWSPPLLVFNAACASYCEEVKCRCSALVALDPVQNRLVWQTPHLVSNNLFIVEGDWIYCGYGFTAEPDFLYVVEKSSGLIASGQALDAAPEYLELQGDTLAVITSKSFYRFKVSLAQRDLCE